VGNQWAAVTLSHRAEGESQTDGWWAEERHPPAIHGSIIKDQKKRIMGRRDTGDDKGVSFAPFSPYLFMNTLYLNWNRLRKARECSVHMMPQGPESLTKPTCYSPLIPYVSNSRMNKPMTLSALCCRDHSHMDKLFAGLVPERIDAQRKSCIGRQALRKSRSKKIASSNVKRDAGRVGWKYDLL
jgi:hypothetical protein